MSIADRRCVYRYYFLPEDDLEKEEPLIYCPVCEEDVTQEDSINIVVEYLVGEDPVVLKSRLECGVLQDTPDLKVLRHGKDSVTCAHCKTDLADLDNVYEEELII